MSDSAQTRRELLAAAGVGALGALALPSIAAAARADRARGTAHAGL